MKKIALLEELLVSLLIVLFLYTAVSKLADHNTFKDVLGKSELLSRYAGVLWWLIPTLEIFIVISLLFSRTRLTGLIASVLLLICFTIYIGYMLLYNKHLPCGCGGVLKSLTWKGHVYFNLFLILIGLIALKLHKKNVAIGTPRTPP